MSGVQSSVIEAVLSGVQCSMQTRTAPAVLAARLLVVVLLLPSAGLTGGGPMGALNSQPESLMANNIFTLGSMFTAACCCKYYQFLTRGSRGALHNISKGPPAHSVIPHRGDVECPSPPTTRCPVERRAEAADTEQRRAAPPVTALPLIRPERDHEAEAAHSVCCRSAPASPHQSRDSVLVDAYFYQFYIERDQLPPELQQTASPPCTPGRPAAHSAPALCVGMAGSASLDSPSGRGGAVLCRSPTSTFKLCELEEPPATFKLPSPLSVEEYHEFDT